MQSGGGASLGLPLRTGSGGRRDHGSFAGCYSPPSSTEAINGPVREPAREQPPGGDRLIVGVDFGTTFSGWVTASRPRRRG